MDDKRNIIMAVLLTGIILFGWPLLMERFFPDMANKNEAVEKADVPATDQVPAGTAAPASGPATGGTDIAAAPASDKIRPLAAVLRENPRVLIDTPRLKGSINLKGGRIDDLTLTDHTVDMSKDSKPVRLFAPSGTEDAYFSRFGWAGQGVAVPDDNTIWSPDGNRLTPETPVTLNWANETGQTYTITLSIDSDYLITSEQTVINRGESPVALRPYGLINRKRDLNNIPPSEASTWTIHSGPVGVYDGAANYDVDYKNLAGEEPGFFARLFGTSAVAGTNSYDTDVSWLGFTDKYWLAALIPDNIADVDAKFRSGGGDIFQAEIAKKNPQIIAPGQQLKNTTRLFSGAKENAVLVKYQDE